MLITRSQHGQDAFENYVRQYGRDSGRRDLLTKILSIKSAEESPMTEPELYNEISNLIFAGTGTLLEFETSSGVVY